MTTKILYGTYTAKSTEGSVLAEIQDAAEIYIEDPEEAEIELDFPKKFKINISVEEVKAV